MECGFGVFGKTTAMRRRWRGSGAGAAGAAEAVKAAFLERERGEEREAHCERRVYDCWRNENLNVP